MARDVSQVKPFAFVAGRRERAHASKTGKSLKDVCSGQECEAQRMSNENSSPHATASISDVPDSKLAAYQLAEVSRTSTESPASLTSQDQDIIDCHAEATVGSVSDDHNAGIDRENRLGGAMSCTVAAEFDTLHQQAEVGQLVESKDASVPAPDIAKVKAWWLREVMELEEVASVPSVEAYASLPALDASLLIALEHSATAVGSEEADDVADEKTIRSLEQGVPGPIAELERVEQHPPVTSDPRDPPSVSGASPVSPLNIDETGTIPPLHEGPRTDPSDLADEVTKYVSEGKKNKESKKNKRKRET